MIVSQGSAEEPPMHSASSSHPCCAMPSVGFFESNKFSSLILRLVETFWDQPSVVHPVLNFYAELVLNKSQRIRFDSNSANGIILFKETFKIVSTYAQRILMIKAPDPTD